MKQSFAEICEYCGLDMHEPLDHCCNRGAQHHRTCGLAVNKLRGIVRNDIVSALDDCVELRMSAEQMRDVIRARIAKVLKV